MAKVLFIEASPRKGRSYSTQAAQAFLDAYQAAHPGDTVETLDLWAADLPAFDGATLDAKYAVMGGKDFTAEQAQAWGKIVAAADHFKAADKIVIATPMWNFSVPYVLKHYIDVIAQPGQTFGWSPDQGYFGLVKGKPALVVTASMGAYGPGSGAEAIDFQKPYVEWMLKFFGFETIHSLQVINTGMPDSAEASLAEAKVKAEALAKAF
ncbi:FMN-dependent NADH-azoreductase [Phreatobacter cathodiphilus]|uniref:FMN dependent NADH:quinone oxidoreductase n=1 Tax=Phreatobacter cathodiphilus TaxID=1868589 RepID=A0A2S0N8Y7_9HYPH|nr:NAD(P)H-dependent oxidoreductase [Phreatobacter cathodiphilus]AVO44630.1 FMN-dependent NADH-azoreductase [Phreatobacter cathodiphilus]